jgi:serine/threonine protein kinase/tetratricopeptide (TPR) repeat protein
MPTLPTLDDVVAKFEAALARDSQADLSSFLPDESHPLRASTLVELVRIELEHEWEKGQPRNLDSYFLRFPEVFAETARRQEVAYEEFRLRRQVGQDPDPLLYAKQYGIETKDWPVKRNEPADSPVSIARSYRDLRRQAGFRPGDVHSWLQTYRAFSVARIFHDLHQADPRVADRLAEGLTELPQAGDAFLDFDLVEELGRGAFGRVFLARQVGLANRLVALKIAPDVGGESQTLAQLQHTHIVPLYSIHRAGPLQAVCMPYFGSVTLADVQRDLSKRPSLPQSGAELLSQLAPRSSPLFPANGGEGLGVRGQTTEDPLTSDPGSPQSRGRGEEERKRPPLATLKRLERLSYVESIVWLGCCLADGLAHAHERGILHRDLKPANVLLTDEGQPMLLDFNLSEDVKLRTSVSVAVVGGTIPYMAPEQLRAFSGSPTQVDSRADIFALGIILYQLLAGRSPFPPPAQDAPAGPSDTDMDVFVAGVLQSRISPPIPIDRYNRSVTPAVWSILRRCLDADPDLRYQDARQLQEDLQRQLDNEPLRHAPDPSLGERIRKRFRRSPKLLSRLIIGFTCVLVLLAAGLAYRALEAKKVEERRIEAKEKLDTSLADSINALFTLSIDEGPTRQAEGVRQARAIFDRYQLDRDDWRKGPLVAPLNEDERRKLEQQLGELILVTARAVSSRDALPLLARAEDLFGEVSPALLLQRADVLEDVGQIEEGKRMREEARHHPPLKARDYYLPVRKMLRDRKFREALPKLERASAIEPDNLSAHLHLGICYYHLDRYKDAISSYNACVALAPKFRGGFLNRALAYAGLDDHGPAIADYDRVIELDPTEPDGYLDRGLSHLAVGKKHSDDKHLQAAVEDFTRVLQLDPSQTRALFQRSVAKKLLKDIKGAEEDFQAGLKSEPSDDRSWNLLGDIHRDRNEMEEALRCYDRGLAFNPRSLTNLTNKACVLADPLGKTNDALDVFDRVVRLFPDYPYAYFNRGILLARLGRRKEALDDARKALERSNEPKMLYCAACIYAQTSRQTPTDADEALSLLHRALRGGFGMEELPGDADLKPLNSHSEFTRLREMARNLAVEPRRK